MQVIVDVPIEVENETIERIRILIQNELNQFSLRVGSRVNDNDIVAAENVQIETEDGTILAENRPIATEDAINSNENLSRIGESCLFFINFFLIQFF